MLTFKQIAVASKGQTKGQLVLFDEKLVGVVTCLEDLDEDLNGKWYVDVAFNGLESLKDRVFEDLSAVRDAFAAELAKHH